MHSTRCPGVAVLALLGALLAPLGCSEPPTPTPAPPPAQVAIDDLERPPAVRPADAPHRDVFKLLDGEWRGQFRIYVDGRGQQPGPRPTGAALDPDRFTKPPYRLDLEIAVEQTYVSESPFFQRVTIVDTYTDGAGKPQVVRSRGVNKVQDGKLWCVVKKPDDLVVHAGALDGRDTIVWQRDRRAPLAIEHFRETVARDHYTIVGWGYYGDDDPSLAPRRYFVATYRRPTK